MASPKIQARRSFATMVYSVMTPAGVTRAATVRRQRPESHV
jgi:hypothetical protein